MKNTNIIWTLDKQAYYFGIWTLYKQAYYFGPLLFIVLVTYYPITVIFTGIYTFNKSIKILAKGKEICAYLQEVFSRNSLLEVTHLGFLEEAENLDKWNGYFGLCCIKYMMTRQIHSLLLLVSG